MRKRNEQLHAEVARVVDLKTQIPPLKQIADRHRVQVQTVRKMVSKAMRAKINKDTVPRETESP
jgi:hypothetical protein